MSNALMTVPEKKNLIRSALDKRAEELAALMPTGQADSAPRLINVAVLYFGRDPKLHEVTPASFIQCVFDSVSSGIPLDGKLGHAVAFNCKVKLPDGKEVWEKQVKFMPDFKGIVSVARRTGQIDDAQSGVVFEHDHFKHGRIGPNLTLEHVPAEGERGAMRGVYCILTFDDGDWTYEYMTKAEVDKVRASSKAANDGPWVNWYEQMARKTVLKRALKTYCDDPQLLAAVQADNDWHDMRTQREARVQRSTITAAALPKLNGTKAIASVVADQQDERDVAAASAPAGEETGDEAGDEPQSSPTDEIAAKFSNAASADAVNALCDEYNHPDAGSSAEVKEFVKACADAALKRLSKKPTQRNLT